LFAVCFVLFAFGVTACGDPNQGQDPNDPNFTNEYDPYQDEFTAVGNQEIDLTDGWVGAGSPSEARIEEVIRQGARVVSFRPDEKEDFDEESLVEDAGGEFDRFAMSPQELDTEDFREDLYDFIDLQFYLGGFVYLHCASLSRVGLAWALYHYERVGLPADVALDIGRAAGLGELEPFAREVMGLPPMNFD